MNDVKISTGDNTLVLIRSHFGFDNWVSGTFAIDKLDDLDLPDGQLSLSNYAIRLAGSRGCYMGEVTNLSDERRIDIAFEDAKAAKAVWLIFAELAFNIA